MRVTVHEIIQLQAASRDMEAKTLGQKMIAANPHVPAVDLVRALVETHIPSPPIQAAAAAAKH
jgi:hypothetical protein